MRIYKYLSLLLCCFFCVGSFTVKASASMLSINPGEISEQKVTELLMNDKYQNSAYQEQISDIPEIYEPIVIRAVDYSAAYNTDAVRMDSFNGRENILLWSDMKGSIEWEFYAPRDGLYQIKFDYFALPGSTKNIELAMELNGEIYTEAQLSFYLTRAWEDDPNSKNTDSNGNQFAAVQIEKSVWQTSFLKDEDGLEDSGVYFHIHEGKNTLTLYSIQEPFALEHITLVCEKEPVSYNEYIDNYTQMQGIGDEKIHIEAENASLKSDQALVGSTDLSSPLTSPESVSVIRINQIGNNWSSTGQWLEWNFDVKETGLYRLSVRYKQNSLKGFYSNRRLYIDGKIPFKEAKNIEFGYADGWEGFTFKIDGNDVYFYLESGTHTLRMEVVQGKLGETVERLDSANFKLSEVYRSIVMITGASPDRYRDYNLQTAIPSLIDDMTSCKKVLEESYKEIQNINQSSSREAAILELLAAQLGTMIENPETIPMRLESFNSNLSSFAAWILDIRSQPLILDWIEFNQMDSSVTRSNGNIFENVWHEMKLFFNSFVKDYNIMSNAGDDAKTITMWLGTGRDQAQVIRMMINDMFTPEYNINVNLKLVNASIIEAFLSGNAPDVSIMMGRSQPVNLAARGALLDLSQFSDFDEVKSQFNPDAFVPFVYRDGCYGVPDTQNFFMMFYRKDIFEELDIEVPETWDDFYYCMAVINRNKMNVGLPYTTVDAWGAVDSGMGARNIFPAILLQNGGKFYSDDLSKTALDTSEAKEAFKQWTEFYTLYGVPLTYDFYNRFRTGQMPLAIASYLSYNQLEAAAPEIRGLWDIKQIPGVLNKDGSINNVQAGSSTASVILSTTKNKEDAWTFIKWWTSAKAQARYSRDMESRLGPLGRQGVANPEAIDLMSWDNDVAEEIKAQLMKIDEIPEVVGSYYTVRGIDNAFRSAVYDEKNPLETLAQWNEQINSEISKKRREFGIGNEQ